MNKKRKTTQAALSDVLDKVLLQVIRKGMPLLNKDGKAILDNKGKPIFTPATANYLNVARQRLRDLGYTKIAAEGDEIEQLAKELGLKDGKVHPFPRLSIEPDAASTADQREGVA